MDDKIFNILMKKLQCVNWCKGEIAFDAKHENYSISFGEVKDDSVDMIIEISEFGADIDGLWVNMTPSDNQYSYMVLQIDMKYEELEPENTCEPFTMIDYTHFESLIFNSN